MKLLTLMLFLALTSVVAVHAQSRNMADATYALKGPVRSFKTEVATFVQKDGDYVEGSRVVQTEAKFNTDGNRTDLYMYKEGILSRRIEMKFDGHRMIECINYDGAGKAWLRTVDSYDSAGRLKEETNYNGDGSLRSKTTFRRNERGQIVESSEYSAAGILLEQINNKYEGPALHTSERKVFRPDGKLLTTELYMAPNKKDTTNYRPDGSVANRSVRIGQEVAHDNADGSLQKFTTISDQGRLLDELSINEQGPTARESQIPDEVDEQGNWTKQTKWFVDANNRRPLIVTYRTITYYDN
jgi:hypothetical protein